MKRDGGLMKLTFVGAAHEVTGSFSGKDERMTEKEVNDILDGETEE